MTTNMRHRGCDGRINEDFENAYTFEGEDAEMFGSVVPRYVCSKCGVEIMGDSQIVDPYKV